MSKFKIGDYVYDKNGDIAPIVDIDDEGYIIVEAGGGWKARYRENELRLIVLDMSVWEAK